MHRQCIGKLQLFELFKGIFCKTALIKFHCHHFCICIDLTDNAHVTVKNTAAFVNRNPIFSAYLPLHLIVVAGLHDFVTFPEFASAGIFLILFR